MSSDLMPPLGSGEDTLPEPAGAPPAEALFALRVAGEVTRQLHEAGCELRFSVVAGQRRVAILMCDLNGMAVARLTPSRALEIATGEPMPGGRR